MVDYYLEIFMDNIIIFRKSFDNYLNNLEIILKKYKDHGTIIAEEEQDERMLITP